MVAAGGRDGDGDQDKAGEKLDRAYSGAAASTSGRGGRRVSDAGAQVTF